MASSALNGVGYRGPTMLEIRGLTKHYGSVTALDGASLTARRGRLLGFLGPNGAGMVTAGRTTSAPADSTTCWGRA